MWGVVQWGGFWALAVLPVLALSSFGLSFVFGLVVFCRYWLRPLSCTNTRSQQARRFTTFGCLKSALHPPVHHPLKNALAALVNKHAAHERVTINVAKTHSHPDLQPAQSLLGQCLLNIVLGDCCA